MEQEEVKRVWVVMYHHRHGIDFWVNSTEEKALEAVGEVMQHWLGDIEDEDHRKKIEFLLSDKKYSSAINEWGEAIEEDFTIEARTVDSTGTLGEIT